jgi:hypothetical protein
MEVLWRRYAVDMSSIYNCLYIELPLFRRRNSTNIWIQRLCITSAPRRQSSCRQRSHQQSPDSRHGVRTNMMVRPTWLFRELL